MRRRGPAEEGVVDTNLAHGLKHLWPINELRDGLDTEHARHVDKTAHGGIVHRVVDHVPDEASLNLEQVDLEGLLVDE